MSCSIFLGKGRNACFCGLLHFEKYWKRNRQIFNQEGGHIKIIIINDLPVKLHDFENHTATLIKRVWQSVGKVKNKGE